MQNKSLQKGLILIVFVLLQLHCAKAQNFTEKYRWLVGTWAVTDKNATTVEEWKIKDDSTLTGVSYLERKDGSRKELEKIELRKRNAKIFYVPQVNGQNSNKEVVFELTKEEENKFVATNEQHDFPQQIGYDATNSTELLAYIEGTIKGKLRRQEWHFKKR